MTLDEIVHVMQCPRCGHEHTLEPQDVEETFTVGDTTVVKVAVRAGVCSYCGERVFDTVATARFDAIITQVRTGNIAQMTPVGTVYRVS